MQQITQQTMQQTRRNTMSPVTQKLKPFVFATALLSLTTLAACSPPWASKPIDFELTGQVLDFDTKQPIEGAYVLAVYEKVDLGPAASARYCVKTKGMVSDKEGRFHFPVEKLDSHSPTIVHAIKPDYFLKTWKMPGDDLVKAQNKATYSDWHVYLKKQDVAKYEAGYGYGECSRPESREAAEANIKYLQLERDELIRIASNFDWFKNSIDTTDRRIQRLQSAPNQK
jgi:hypothetical protein